MNKVLRFAAQDMRQRHGPGHPRHDFWDKLAEWLDGCAGSLESAGGQLHYCDEPGAIQAAVDIAAAYLSGAAL